MAEVDAFGQLLYADQLRGTDGTGIFYNSKKNKAHIKSLKAPIKSSLFCATTQFEAVGSTLFKEGNFAIGHNRAASKGKVSMENTHPFRENHISLVHNGTLTTHKELKDVEVDSHAICHSIATEGAVETLKKIDGAFALVWFDTQEKTLNLCRNWQRPLNLIECVTCYIIVSEMELGLWVAERNKLKVVKKEEVEVKNIYKFNIEDMKVYTKTPVDFKVYVAPPNESKWADNFSYSGGYNNWPTRTRSKQKDEKNFTQGDIIRFRGGEILYTDSTHKTAYVEGDILKWQMMLPQFATDRDFEDEWRIKVFGSDSYLKTFVENKNLIGKVAGRAYRGNVEMYVMSQVETYVPTHAFQKKTETAAVLQLPIKEEKKKQKCGCCDAEYEGRPQYIYQMWCCPACALEWAPYEGKSYNC